MALMWLPVDEALISSMCVLADGSWDDDEIDATWIRAGWNGGSLSNFVFVEREFMAWNGPHRWMCVAVSYQDTQGGPSEVDQITGFGTQFAWLLLDLDSDDDPWDKPLRQERRLVDFLGTTLYESAAEAFRLDRRVGGHRADDTEPWRGDPDADRAEFDAAWRYACSMVSRHRGPPERTSSHSHGLYAVWRGASHLLIVTQQEDLEEAGFCDSVALWAKRLPVGAPLPSDEIFYEGYLLQ